jgi:4-azaleucine resistance transporter AzlC
MVRAHDEPVRYVPDGLRARRHLPSLALSTTLPTSRWHARNGGVVQNHFGRGWYRLAVEKRRKDNRGVGEMSPGRAREAPGGGGLVGGLRAAVPIVFGYLPAAVAFGVAGRAAGLNAIEAVLMSLIVFSGASQFALVGLVASGASWFVMAAISLVIGARHVLYGPSLASHLRSITTGRAAVAAFGLTDEVFAVAITKLSERRPAERMSGTDFGYLLGLGTGAYASWALGTWTGAVAETAMVVAWPSLSPCPHYSLPCSSRSLGRETWFLEAHPASSL